VLRRPPARQLAPLRVAGFRLLFLSTLGSSVGTLFAAIALAIDVKDRTNSGLWVGAVLIVEFLPAIVVGLTLGPLLDRLDRRSLMVGADLLRAAVFCALPFASSAAAIVGLALVAGLATGFFRPAVYASVPNLVPEEQLPEANALIQTIENVSWAIGPVLGGLLTAASGPHTAYWINAGSFLISGLLIVRIPKRLLQSETALTRGHWRDLADGFVAVIRSRPVLAVLIAWGIASLGSGAISLTEVFLAKNTLSAGDFGFGLLYGGIGTGLVIGGWCSSAVVERLGTTRAYAGALLVMAVGFGAAAAAPNIWVAAACCVVGGSGDGVAIVCNALLVQRGVADQMRGRVLTLVMSATYAMTGAGTVVAGVLLGVTSPRWVWAGGAVTFALGAVAAFALTRDEPAVSVEAGVTSQIT
jgi:MFS family permease